MKRPGLDPNLRLLLDRAEQGWAGGGHQRLLYCCDEGQLGRWLEWRNSDNQQHGDRCDCGDLHRAREWLQV